MSSARMAYFGRARESGTGKAELCVSADVSLLSYNATLAYGKETMIGHIAEYPLR
jgi:hypothetical protein